MKNRKKRFLKLSLSHKVILSISFFMIFCAILWTVVISINMTRNAVNNAVDTNKSYIETYVSNSTKLEDVIKMSQKSVKDISPIFDYIKGIKNGKSFSSDTVANIYNNELNKLNNIKQLNPSLYTVRIYANADIIEKSPLFYDFDSLERMPWNEGYESEHWEFDYADMANSNEPSARHLVGLISPVFDDNKEIVAVIEVSTRINEMFENFDSPGEGEYYLLVGDNGYCTYPDNQEHLLSKEEKKYKEYSNNPDKLNKSFIGKFNDRQCVFSLRYMSQLRATLIHIQDTSSTIQSYLDSQYPYLIVVVLSMILFILILIVLIRGIFKRFNRLTMDMRKIAQGEKIKLPEDGEDEISQMANQINNMIYSLEKLNKENTERQLLVKNAQIKSLQNQINAHFMYNVLETIKMMAEIEEDYAISDAVTSLGQMFRYSMKWTDSGMVELKEEINYIKNYLNLLNLRFDYEIILSLNIPEEYYSYKIPKMSLQPLVENSVYHGIEDLAEDTSIYIKLFEKNGIIHLEVSDAGEGMDEQTLNKLRESINLDASAIDNKEHGRALYNVNQRIKMYFGKEYGLEIFSEVGKYTKVVLYLPGDGIKEV